MLSLADQVHAQAWAWLRAVPGGEDLYQEPARRTLLLAVGVVFGAFALTLGAPLALLVAAPILFGVPHVVSDLRFLALRPPRPLPPLLIGLLALPFATMTVLRLVQLAGGPGWPRIELLLGAGSVALAAAWAKGRTGAALATLALLALVPALVWPREAALLFGHAHNFVAVGLWCLFVADRRVIAPVVGALALGLALVGGGAFDGPLLAAGPVAGHSWSGFVATLAPDLPAPWATRAVAAFAMMQAVHYGMWLVCIPDAAQGARAAAPSVRWSAYLNDLGAAGAIAAAVGALALAVAAAVEVKTARSAYLSLVLFHGWLELAIGAHLISRHKEPLATV